MSTVDNEGVAEGMVQERPHPGTGAQFGNEVSQDQDKPNIVEKLEEDTPTMSHKLASAGQDEKCAVDEDHGQTEARDIGWKSHPTDVPNPLVGGISNEELWTLIRRFNKVGIIMRF